jgi:hypothetical protein
MGKITTLKKGLYVSVVHGHIRPIYSIKILLQATMLLILFHVLRRFYFSSLLKLVKITLIWGNINSFSSYKNLIADVEVMMEKNCAVFSAYIY